MTAPTQQQPAPTPLTGLPAALTAALMVQTYAQAVAAIRARIRTFLAGLFASLGNYSNPETFIPTAVATMDAGQRMTAAYTAAYLSQLYGALTGDTVSATAPIGDMTDQTLRGISASEVYRRPFNTLWTDLSTGKPFAEALKTAERRLDTLVQTDLQLATTHTARTVLAQQPKVVGYRRVLSGSGHHCGLCILASTQRYHISDLMPIHPNCSCSVAQVVGDKDPGRSINSAVLTGSDPHGQTPHGVNIYGPDATLDLGDLVQPVHDAIKERFGHSSASGSGRIDYRHVMLTHEHGELGPVLTVKDQHFLTQREIAHFNAENERRAARR
jgi:hypothetical protein